MPFMPGTCSLRASTIAKSASALEQNHLSPVSFQVPSGCDAATVAVALTSDPAPCSVMNMAPCASSSKSSVVRRSRKRLTSLGSP